MHQVTEDFLARLSKVRETSNGWQACCPAHEDDKPSLDICEGEKGVVVNCKAGCQKDSIIQSVGLDWKDLFYNNRNGQPKNGKPKPKKALESKQDQANADLLSRCYSAGLDLLSLSTEHFANLMQRGLSTEAIRAGGYQSTNGGNTTIGIQIKKIAGDNCILIPGMHPNPLILQFDSPSGLLIPVRNLKQQIIALKVRRDKGSPKYLYVSSAKHKQGASPGSPVHFPVGTPNEADIVRITEGELKADVAFALSKIPTVSAPGVNQWQKAFDAAIALKPKTIRIAFDAEPENNNVQRFIAECGHAVLDADLSCEIERWEPKDGKGIDDVLAAGITPEIEVIESKSQLRAVPADLRRADDDPFRLAELNIKSYKAKHGGSLLHYRGNWYRYKRNIWCRFDEDELKAKLGIFIRDEFERCYRKQIESEAEKEKKESKSGADDKPKKEKPIVVKKVTNVLVANVVAALKSLCIVSSRRNQPFWVDESTAPDKSPNEIISLQNRLYHVASDTEIDPTPNYFTTVALPYKLNPDADCDRWLEFLHSVWPDDHESKMALQEWFGYLLLPDTSLQKMLVVIGEPRSGKGTISHAMQNLVGRENCCSPSFTTLAGDFGLQPLVNKRLATINDVRIGRQTDSSRVVGILLGIAGEDPQSVNRKYSTETANIKLDTRIAVFANELPSIQDASKALIPRLLMLEMTESFVGREDVHLKAKLNLEIEGIFCWALAGLLRLIRQGEFTSPESAKSLIAGFSEAISPISEFVSERCETGGLVGEDRFEVLSDELFSEWRRWCESEGRKPGPKNYFSGKLAAAVSGLGRKRRAVQTSVFNPRKNEFETAVEKKLFFTGIRINKEIEKTKSKPKEF